MNKILSLCQGQEEVTFDAGAVILAEGGRTGVLYVLIDGSVGTDNDFCPAANLTEILHDHGDLHVTVNVAGDVQMVAGQHNQVEIWGNVGNPIELLERIVQVRNEKALHRSRVSMRYISRLDFSLRLEKQ